jgi:hypothetical protein
MEYLCWTRLTFGCCRSSSPTHGSARQNWHVESACPPPQSANGSAASSEPASSAATASTSTPPRSTSRWPAWVRIRPGPGQLPKIADLAERTPEVTECHRISGEDCFLLKVHVPAVEALEAVLDRFLMHGQTTSSFIVATPVSPRPVLPTGTGGLRQR